MYTVVIVEDNRATADMLATSIDWQSVGCKVVGVAYNGQKGRMLILQNKPDIIIADIRMPGLDGLTMVETIQAVSPGSKVIYISAYNEFEYVKKALDLRAFDYLLKPFDNDKLLRIVQRIIEEKQQPSEPETVDCGSLSVSTILSYIRNNPSEPMSLQSLSAHFDLSPNYISYLIKKHTGRNYLEWVIDARIGLAKKLLKDPTYRLEEIATVVGYKNYISFYNVFVKHEGISPSNFRHGRRETE